MTPRRLRCSAGCTQHHPAQRSQVDDDAVDALEHNFTEYTVRAHKCSANLADRVEDKAYHEMKIKEAQEKWCFKFTFEEGRKYFKVMFVTWWF